MASAIGGKIRAAREARGLTQAALADAVGTTQQTVDRIERGEISYSKYRDTIFRELSLPNEGFSFDKTMENIQALELESEKLTQSLSGRRAEILDDIPVYAYKSDGGVAQFSDSAGSEIDRAARPAPLRNVRGAYAVLMNSWNMIPAIRPGDIVFVNPHLPVLANNEIILLSSSGDERKAAIRTLEGEESDSWKVRTWLPDEHQVMRKSDWPEAHLIIGRFSRT